MRIFLDTGFFIALSDGKDENHDRAISSFRTLAQEGARFVTGKNVLIEYIDGVTKRISKKKGIEELGNILDSKLLVVEPINERDWNKAVGFFKKYNDQQIDLTDCLSFAVMERLSINTALTFDNDFRVHGLEVII